VIDAPRHLKLKAFASAVGVEMRLRLLANAIFNRSENASFSARVAMRVSLVHRKTVA
jgi:hypothetical protein